MTIFSTTTEMAAKNGILKTRKKSNVKLFGIFPNHDLLIFLHLQQSKFVPRHVQLHRLGFLKIERERTFTAGKNGSYPEKNRSEKVESPFIHSLLCRTVTN